MKDMIYYNPKSNPMSGSLKKTEGGSSEIVIKTENIKTEPVKPSLSATVSSTPLVPQLKLGPNGEMILDESSLVVENTAERDARQAIEGLFPFGLKIWFFIKFHFCRVDSHLRWWFQWQIWHF